MPSVFPTVQGRLIGTVRVIRGSEPSFLIDTETASHEAVLKTISRFTMAGDFKVADVTGETALLTVQGQLAAEVIEKVFETSALEIPVNGVSEVQQVTIIRASHTGENGFDILVDSSQKAELLQALEDAGHNQSVTTHSRFYASKPASLALDVTSMTRMLFLRQISTMR
jgi:glycine cleavage system aminomethyltransferase T